MTTQLVVLSGPSGVGKSSVVQAALAQLPQTWLSVSVTTRAPRPGEVHGVNYLYISNAEFDQMLAGDELLEWAEFAGNRYGTPRQPVLERLSSDIPVLLEIEVQGAKQVRKNMPEAVLVFLVPPSWQDLESRLEGRGTETPEQVALRLEKAQDELDSADFFDYVITNDDVARAADELVSFLK
ncbi:MAG: guanylate kinase [Actinobacteria bacterium]|nr:guanylate kinase [Actinomycetota bacterium]NBY14948.1 guanylate kinase [Actinomycetota bacterium]